ncbi:hypothetical protein GUJ93_ZPchr0012g21797 [Zizania palustris]|uniref:Uncharacterized protein n=1 Tax=Zizania palustris TaxID=103762 RepID=A0A8J6BVH7_ZIZPA|nr:hypothetical protein GUJ93_ZPchr0012g21797 [Zizania palustris]
MESLLAPKSIFALEVSSLSASSLSLGAIYPCLLVASSCPHHDALLHAARILTVARPSSPTVMPFSLRPAASSWPSLPQCPSPYGLHTRLGKPLLRPDLTMASSPWLPLPQP